MTTLDPKDDDNARRDSQGSHGSRRADRKGSERGSRRGVLDRLSRTDRFDGDGPRRGSDGPGKDGRQGKDGKKKGRASSPWISILAVIILLAIAFNVLNRGTTQEVTTSQGLELLAGDTVRTAVVTEGAQSVELELSENYHAPDPAAATASPSADPTEEASPAEGEAEAAATASADPDTTIDKGREVVFHYVEPQGPAVAQALEDADLPEGYDAVVPQQSALMSVLIFMLPMLLILGLFYFFMLRSAGGGGGIMRFGKSKARVGNKEMPEVTFADVAGADEAVEELQEIRQFLAEPGKFEAVGAKVPKGVLLYGPPGTGKTLLAKAVAGEAGVPFFNISGSEFVEMFVGVGASRVRDLFEQAKESAPAIIFVDEIDAVGRHRGTGMGGGHDEREQTLNQLLVEMDGFDANTNVLLIAATNRPDVLDPALLRPGRFDRQVGVDAPDLKGRAAILRVHAQGKPIAPDVDLEAVARRTPGFTGADLANVLNEAALLTARSDAQIIDSRALDEAIDRVIAGPQRRTLIMSEKDKKVTAYHEGGHALTAAALRYTDPVTKVTILPRGRALGYTMVMPTEDRYSVTRNQLLDQLVYALGGRAAEEIVFHDPGTGASNDIDNATDTARKMVTEYGMSERIGAVKLGSGDTEPFLGRDMGSARGYSEDIARQVDEEVRKLMDTAHDEAWRILTENREVLDHLVVELMEKETLGEKELATIFEPVVKCAERPVWLSSPDRPVSDIPPVRTPREIEAEARGEDPDEAGASGTGGTGGTPGGPLIDPIPGQQELPGEGS